MKETSLAPPFARGRTADVHAWDAGHVLKLFHPWFNLDSIEYERKIARAVHASGVKTPAVLDLVQVQGRNGLIYERAAGQSMLQMFARKPWMLFTYARDLARLHLEMHECSFDTAIPTQRSRLWAKLNEARALPTSLKETLLKALDSLPEGDRICHGDFHPDNVLVSEKETVVIDWIDASRGNPLADVARTSVILLGAAASSQSPGKLQKTFVKVFHSTYLKHYFRQFSNRMDEYRRWLPIVAGARLSENIPEIEEWLIDQARKVE
ncbi:MAG: aminoglycoside phosphotransferase family protein [Anaerolineales bacterium]